MRDLFLKIWNERPHYSEVSFRYLGEYPYAYFFSHILSRGSHPELAKVKENIMLMTLEEHQVWEFGSPSGPIWDKVKERKQEMKELALKIKQKKLFYKS